MCHLILVSKGVCGTGPVLKFLFLFVPEIDFMPLLFSTSLSPLCVRALLAMAWQTVGNAKGLEVKNVDTHSVSAIRYLTLPKPRNDLRT